MAPTLFILAGLCAVINWVGLARRNPALERAFKPAAQGAILAGAWIATGGPHMSWLAAFFLPALALSLVGDVLLMLGEPWFRAGLVAFLLAHVGYVLGLNETLPPWPSLAVAVPIAITWWVVVRHLRTGLRGTGKDALVGPVTVYSFGLGAFLFSAWATLFRSDWPAVRQALVVCGGALFSVSDLLLGWDRFVRPWPTAKLHVRVTYHLAQLALASSLLVTG